MELQFYDFTVVKVVMETGGLELSWYPSSHGEEHERGSVKQIVFITFESQPVDKK